MAMMSRQRAVRSLLRTCLQQAECYTSSSVLPAAAATSHLLAKQLHYAAAPTSSMASHSKSRMVPWAGCGQTRGMFIQTQPTPNPQSLMFVPGKPVMESGSHEFSSARAGMASPLAKKLFTIDGVSAVFFGSDFVTVTKKDDYTWAVLKPDIFAAIMDHYSSGEPLFYDKETMSQSDTAIQEDDDEVVAMIKELLETRIRPAVQEDGGDISFRSFNEETGIVTLKMHGACSGCPSSSVTLKSGVENMLMHYIPEVKGVVEEAGEEGEGGECSSHGKEEQKEENPMAQHLSP